MSVEEDERSLNEISISRLIDSTLLSASATEKDFERLAEEALLHNFRSVCVPPSRVSHMRTFLPSNYIVCTVVGFPFGYSTLEAKVKETKSCLELGANEIDFVQNPYLVKDRNWAQLSRESLAIVRAAEGLATKVILETALLSNEEIEKCVEIHARAGVAYMKTSTGYSTRGASTEDVLSIQRALAKVQSESQTIYGIKASGGIRTRKEADFFARMGVHRIGTSQGSAITLNKTPNESKKGDY